jgi:hypothetical protein
VTRKSLATLVALSLLGACSGGDAPQQPATNTSGGGQAAGESVPVPSDPNASYRLLEWRAMPNGHREAVTRRDGPSGTSFSRREIDCSGRQFRYLGEGDTIEDARTDSASIGEMEDLVAGSISTEVSMFVCGKPSP